MNTVKATNIWSITQYEYDKKATELKQRQYELDERLKRITEADESYSITLITLLNLCSRASELFESSKVEQKRQLINFLLSNLKLRSKNLEYTLNKPFDVLVNLDYRSNWLGRKDSNQNSDFEYLYYFSVKTIFIIKKWCRICRLFLAYKLSSIPNNI